jgi:hypothetical protein
MPRTHITSLFEIQEGGILLQGTGQHTVRVLGALRKVSPPIFEGAKEEIEPQMAPELYERYYAGELAGAQEDPAANPLYPRVPALFVTQASEVLFLERDLGA